MSNCIVIVQFPLAKRTEEQSIEGGTGTAPTYVLKVSRHESHLDYNLIEGDEKRRA